MYVNYKGQIQKMSLYTNKSSHLIYYPPKFLTFLFKKIVAGVLTNANPVPREILWRRFKT